MGARLSKAQSPAAEASLWQRKFDETVLGPVVALVRRFA
jgi:hypothetical protein